MRKTAKAAAAVLAAACVMAAASVTAYAAEPGFAGTYNGQLEYDADGGFWWEWVVPGSGATAGPMWIRSNYNDSNPPPGYVPNPNPGEPDAGDPNISNPNPGAPNKRVPAAENPNNGQKPDPQDGSIPAELPSGGVPNSFTPAPKTSVDETSGSKDADKDEDKDKNGETSPENSGAADVSDGTDSSAPGNDGDNGENDGNEDGDDISVPNPKTGVLPASVFAAVSAAAAAAALASRKREDK